MGSSKRKHTLDVDEESWEANRRKPSRASVLLSQYGDPQPVSHTSISSHSDFSILLPAQSTIDHSFSRTPTAKPCTSNPKVSKGSKNLMLSSTASKLLQSKSSSSLARPSLSPSKTHEVIDLTIEELEETENGNLPSPPREHRHTSSSPSPGSAEVLSQDKRSPLRAPPVQALDIAPASLVNEHISMLPPRKVNLSAQMPTPPSSQQSTHNRASKVQPKKLSNVQLALAAAARPQTRILPPNMYRCPPQETEPRPPINSTNFKTNKTPAKPSAGAPHAPSNPDVILDCKSQSQEQSVQSRPETARHDSQPPQYHAVAQAEKLSESALSEEAAEDTESEESESDDKDLALRDCVILSSVEGEDGLDELETGNGNEVAMVKPVRDKKGKFAGAESKRHQQTLERQTRTLSKSGQREIRSSGDEAEDELIFEPANERLGVDTIPSKESLAAMKLALSPAWCAPKLSPEQAEAIKIYISKLEIFQDAQCCRLDKLQDCDFEEKAKAKIMTDKNMALNDKCAALAKKLSKLEPAAARLQKLEQDMVKAGVTTDLLKKYIAMEKKIEDLCKTSSDQRSQISQLEGIRLSYKHQTEGLERERCDTKERTKMLQEHITEVDSQRMELARKAWKHENETSLLNEEIKRLKPLEAAIIKLKRELEHLKTLRDTNAKLAARLELLKPLADAGAKVRKGFMEQSRIRVFGPSCSINRSVIHEATDAAHLYSAAADYSLLQAGYWDEEKNGDLFKLMYGVDKWHDLEQDEIVRNMMAMPEKIETVDLYI